MKYVLFMFLAVMSMPAHASQPYSCTCQITIDDSPLITSRNEVVQLADANETFTATRVCQSVRYSLYVESIEGSLAIAVLDGRDSVSAFPAVSKRSEIDFAPGSEKIKVMASGLPSLGTEFKSELWCTKLQQ